MMRSLRQADVYYKGVGQGQCVLKDVRVCAHMCLWVRVMRLGGSVLDQMV